jgi:hypothetical protein
VLPTSFSLSTTLSKSAFEGQLISDKRSADFTSSLVTCHSSLFFEQLPDLSRKLQTHRLAVARGKAEGGLAGRSFHQSFCAA